jgi:hypothetical protein
MLRSIRVNSLRQRGSFVIQQISCVLPIVGLTCGIAPIAAQAETAPVRIKDFPYSLTQAQPLQAESTEPEEEITITIKKELESPITATPTYQIDQAAINKQGANSVAETLRGQPGFSHGNLLPRRIDQPIRVLAQWPIDQYQCQHLSRQR